jgi:hypothetical protein
MSLKILTQRFDTFVQLITAKVKNADGGSLVVDTGSLAAGASKNYDLTTLLPEGKTAADFYLLTALVDLKIIDPDATSPFSGQAISADASMSYGINTSGVLTIRNYHTASVTYWLRVTTPALK